MAHSASRNPFDMTRRKANASGPEAGARPGEQRSSGKKPSATNVSRGGGSAASTARNQRSQSKAKS